MENAKTDLFRHLFIRALITGEIQVRFDGVGATVSEIVEGKCYQALQTIRELLDDRSLSDENCFERIERIVYAFEEFGSDGGSRHTYEQKIIFTAAGASPRPTIMTLPYNSGIVSASP